MFKIIVTYESDFKSYYAESFSTLPRLVDMDYRIELKQYNRKMEKERIPILQLLLTLEQKNDATTQNDNTDQNLTDDDR